MVLAKAGIEAVVDDDPAGVLAAQHGQPLRQRRALHVAGGGRARLNPLARALRIQCNEFGQRQGHHAPGPVAGVDEAADVAQADQLFVVVLPLAQGVARGHGKTIAPLPHPQRVFGQPGVAFDIGNGVGGGG